MEYVFIVGIARTGSKIYMSSLNRYSDIDLVGEMHYLAPRYVRKDAVTALGLNDAPLTTLARIEAAVDKMYSGTLKGTFWKKGEPTEELQQRLADIDRQTIVKCLEQSDGTSEAVFKILLTEHARVAGKNRAGAKFPVDISCVSQMMKWFPSAKFVHLIRDPKAIYGSMVSREFRGLDKLPAKRFLAALRRLPYLILQFKRAAMLHRELCGSRNYYMSRFEDVVRDPEEHFQRLCTFLDTGYRTEMLNIRKVDSSYGKASSVGIDRSAVNQWKAHVSAIERSIIDTALKAEMRLFSYA